MKMPMRTKALCVISGPVGGCAQVEAFDLLVYLVENRDPVVTTDDLPEAVWDGHIVSAFTFTTRINAAHRALGDSGPRPRW